MIGGTWAGASAAGTAGIIGGTSGVIGTAAAILTAPLTIIILGGTPVLTGGFELGCMFTDVTIKDYATMDSLVRDIALTGGDNFMYNPGFSGSEDAMVRVLMSVKDGEKIYETFKVSKMHVRNGELMHSDWGPNTKFCNVVRLDAKGAPGTEGSAAAQQ